MYLNVELFTVLSQSKPRIVRSRRCRINKGAKASSSVKQQKDGSKCEYSRRRRRDYYRNAKLNSHQKYQTRTRKTLLRCGLLQHTAIKYIKKQKDFKNSPLQGAKCCEFTVCLLTSSQAGNGQGSKQARENKTQGSYTEERNGCTVENLCSN